MKTSTFKLYRTPYFIGLGLIIISFIIYLTTKGTQSKSDFFSQSFFINFAISIGYFIFLIAYKLKCNSPRPKIAQACWINVVVLFTISAFALNQDMEVFAQFPQWLTIYTLLLVALLLSYPFINYYPKLIVYLIYILSGSALLLSLYMAFYLLTLVPLSLLVCWFFGISFHTFVPFLWIWIIIDFFKKRTEPSKLKQLLWIGFVAPLIILSIYVYKWGTLQTEIKDIIAIKNRQLSNQLPDAITLAQKLPSDPMTEEILVSPIKSQKFWDDGFGIGNNSEKKFHDPLSIISTALYGELDVDVNTVETILNIRKDYRHKFSRRLWIGSNLTTSSISNNIQVFPQYRLAYHEKTVVIHNNPNKNNRDSWFVDDTQEGVYTFHIPEGSIVTSLSLWINGKEQKSRLSTRQKADSAYTNIVGVQRRDPAIVYWNEGNTITVNVFPCSDKEDRTFKIGFTTPLRLSGNKLYLENCWFEGPDFNDAREATSIRIENNLTEFIELPSHFEKMANGEFHYQGEYIPDWKLAMKPVLLSKNTFSFNGFSYSLKEIKSIEKKLTTKKIFLDITKDWNEEEYDKIINECGNSKCYAWLPEAVEITNNNKNLVWKEACKNQFSIPFLNDIQEPENTIIITKSGGISPILADLKQSDYAQNTIDYLVSSQSKITVLNFGNELSPLWRSLNELRLVDYHLITTDELYKTITTNKINVILEDSNTIVLQDSYMCITKEKVNADTLLKSDAPDHLLRLFAYNDVLIKIGKKYFEKEKYEQTFFKEAEEAYVVTPLTSMIVLESEEDYKRMGISENTNTVGNAGILKGGAVPEPHEWLLIAVVIILIAHHLFKKYKLSLGNSFSK